MNFNILTLGCKVNQYESQAMHEALISSGYIPSLDKDHADITVVNSCTVTSVSDSKNRKLINRIRRLNPNGIIVLTGCMPQAFPEEMKKLSGCDIIIGNKNRSELVPAIEKYLADNNGFIDISAHQNTEYTFEPMSVSSFEGHTRAFIKIEDGCNRFCSYCIIPYARGRVRSKPLDALRLEIEQLAANGYREVVLVGINISAYGLNEDFDLADAVECVCGVQGIERVRLGSIEPERMDEVMIKRLAAQKKFCPQFHLSLQSGCNNTLKNMRRHYTTDEYAQIVNNIRTAFDNSSITTDIMVGFAGETEEDFKTSMDFAEQIGFAKIHVFPYSVRRGTAAASAQNQIEPAEKERRAALMNSLAKKLRSRFLKTQIGMTEEVLVERQRRGCLEGYTKNYTPVRIRSDKTELCGKTVNARLVAALDDYCEAELV